MSTPKGKSSIYSWIFYDGFGEKSKRTRVKQTTKERNGDVYKSQTKQRRKQETKGK
jgi:hypothetical protein